MLSLLRIFCTFLLLISPAAKAETPQIYAAASMAGALEQLTADFEQQTGNKVTSVFASSSTLARQISQGAPAALYISANQRWANYLQQQGHLLADSLTPLVSNQLVLVAPITSPLPVQSELSGEWLIKALGEQRLAVADPDHVPAGIYAAEAFESLGISNKITPKFARAANVRAALAYVERGATPLGVVYRSDAVQSDKVKIVGQFAAASHQPIHYPMALVSKQQSAVTQAFYNYLLTDQAQKLLQQRGFSPRPSAEL